MKNGLKLVLSVCFAIELAIALIGCASTVKYSPDLTKENAATLVIEHFIPFIHNPTNNWYEDGSWLLTVPRFDDEWVEWKKGRKETKVLIPPGEHVLECWIYNVTGITIVASIRINAQVGENNLSSRVFQDKLYSSRSELYRSMDEIFYFSVMFGDDIYKFTYEDTPQFYKDRQEGKTYVSLNTTSVILEPPLAEVVFVGFSSNSGAE